MKLNRTEFKRLEAIAQAILKAKHGGPQTDSNERVIDFRLTEAGIEIEAHDPEDGRTGARLPKITLDWEELEKLFP